ncbi:MAG: PAS domain S-box protein [Acidobacteriota bacterium]|nr:PAS domain S-box protein [Acidobacteriota bacterium]
MPIVAFTVEGKITLWNEAAERLFGWRADEVLGGAIPFVPADKLEEHRAMRARDLQGEGFTEQELRRRRKDGTAVDIRVSTAPLRDATGKITAIMSVYVDVTEHKGYERRLLAQNGVARILAATSSMDEAAPRILQTLCENLEWRTGLFWTLEASGEYCCAEIWQRASDRGNDFANFCRGYLLPPGAGLPGRIWVSKEPAWIVDVHDDPDFRRLNAAASAGLRTAFGFPIVLGGCVYGVMEFFNDEVKSPDRDLIGMAAAVGYQIGEFLERHRAQKNLADREASHRALTETAADGIVTIDARSTILFANSAVGRIFGYTLHELLGSDLTMLMPEYLQQVHKTAFARYQLTGERHISWQAVQVPGRHKEGQEIPLEISFAEHEQDSKRVFIGIIRDVTERKRFDEKLQQTAKLESLGLLAGGIAHDFNNLLTGILGNTSLAIEMLPTPHPAIGPLKDATDASEKAANLVKQLLAYAGKGRFVIQRLDLSVIARETSTLVKGSIPKTVHLRLDLGDHLPCVEGDETQIQQIIMNLIINGAEAIGESEYGTVLVTTGVQHVDQDYIDQTFGHDQITPGKHVSLEVHDTGSGMDEATIGKIFDPFFTTKFTGRGLGLAAVLGIVRGHKGALKVYSTQGKGTTFKVLFPAKESQAAEPPPEQLQHQFAAKGTVLVVDDEQIIRKVAASILERFGFRVLVAENGREAVEIFEQMPGQISLVILDLTMPVMNGEEALREIKILSPHVPILLSSGFNEMEAIQRFAGKGLAGFVQKPYTSARLAEKLEQVLKD